MINLQGLCDDARKFWSEGPWLVPDLTTCHSDRHLVPFHYLGKPEIEALATPELVQDALAMDRGAIEVLDRFLHRMTPAATKETP
jgi:hypothetical protein